MIIGDADIERAMVEVVFVTDDRPGPTFSFVVDTGFEGALLMPLRDVQTLGLERVTDTKTYLADNSTLYADVYSAAIVWDGMIADVSVIAMGERPLLGTALMAYRRLTIDFVLGGKVSIEALPPV